MQIDFRKEFSNNPPNFTDLTGQPSSLPDGYYEYHQSENGNSYRDGCGVMIIDGYCFWSYPDGKPLMVTAFKGVKVRKVADICLSLVNKKD